MIKQGPVVKLARYSGLLALVSVSLSLLLAYQRSAREVSRDALITPSGFVVYQKIAKNSGPKVYATTVDKDVTRYLSILYPAGYDARWSPDGRKIAYVSTRSGVQKIMVVSNRGGNRRELTDSASDNSLPTWSPDGKYIAFVSRRDGNEELYMMSSDGTNQTRLTDNPGFDDDPTWSPDGKQIAWTSERGENVDIYAIDIHSRQEMRLTRNDDLEAAPKWSPDGKYIAYTSWQRSVLFWLLPQPQIHLIDLLSVKQYRLTKGPGRNHSPTWSPDGNFIAFTKEQDKGMQIYMMRADGGHETPVVSEDADYTSFQWVPDAAIAR